jgi:hypothetical protein
MLVWDPSDFTTYGILVLVWRDFGDNVLGDCVNNAWMIAVGWEWWSITTFPFDAWRLGVMDSLSVCGHIDFPWISDFRVGLGDSTEIELQNKILDSGDISLRHYSLRMHSR